MLAEPSVRPLEDDESQWPLSKYQDQAYQAFSTCQTTEEQFRSETHEFYGAYGYIREQLDHQYHVCYRKERQWLHDSIIEGYLQDGASANPSQLPTDPWLILTVGCQGAGKRYVVETLTDDKRLGLISYVMVDAGTLVNRVCLTLTSVQTKLVSCFPNTYLSFPNAPKVWINEPKRRVDTLPKR